MFFPAKAWYFSSLPCVNEHHQVRNLGVIFDTSFS